MHHIRLESFERENSVLGMIADVMMMLWRRSKLSVSGDIDLLTGMYNRRAFTAIWNSCSGSRSS